MRHPEIGAYGGIVARVLREAMSFSTALTGFTLVLGLSSIGYLFSKSGHGDVFQVLMWCVLAVVLARFAVNGYSGEWQGTLFSTKGGTWMEVGMISARFLALTSVWALPLYALGARPSGIGASLGAAMMGMGEGNTLALSVMTQAAALLSPPLFLVVSVKGDRFLDVIRPDHWKKTLAGRISDLFLIYVVYLGTLGMTAVIVLPILVALGVNNLDAAKFMGFMGLVFGGGLSVTLLGRLCGFYAAGDADTTPERVAEPAPVSVGAAPPPVALPVRTVTPSSGGVPRPMSGTFRAGTSGAFRAENGNAPGRVILMDAKARVDEAVQRFEHNPEEALASLRQLRQDFVPNPIVLHALCSMEHRAGRIDDSLRTAKEAMTLCLQRGAHRQAAEIFAMHREHYERFELNRDMALLLADHLRHSRDFSAAEVAYSHILNADPNDLRAMKGLLQVAQERLRERAFEDSRRIHQYLVKRCGDSPLAAHMREGLAESERRLAQAS